MGEVSAIPGLYNLIIIYPTIVTLWNAKISITGSFFFKKKKKKSLGYKYFNFVNLGDGWRGDIVAAFRRRLLILMVMVVMMVVVVVVVVNVYRLHLER